MSKLKIPIGDLNAEDLKKIKERNIGRAKQFFQSCPFATKVFMCLKTGLPMEFIKNNWEEITSSINKYE